MYSTNILQILQESSIANTQGGYLLQIQRRGVAQVRQLPVVLQQYNTAFLEAMWMMMMMMMMMKKLVINEARMMVTS